MQQLLLQILEHTPLFLKVAFSMVCFLIFSFSAKSQGINYRVNNGAATGEWYFTNDPTHIVGKITDSSRFEFMSPNILFSGVDTNSASPSTGTLVWMNSLNFLKRTTISSMRFSQTNISGLSDSLLSKVNNSQIAAVAKSGSYLDLTNTPTIPTNNNQLTNGNGYISGITSGNVTAALGFTPANAATSGTVTGITAGFGLSGGTVTSSGTFGVDTSNISILSRQRAALTYQPIGSYLTANQPVTITATGDAAGVSSSSATAPSIALTLANSGVTAGTYNSSYTVDAKGRITAANNLSFNNAPSVTIQTVAAAANGNQLSATRSANVNYSVTIVSTATIAGGAVGYIVLEICSTNSAIATDWIEIGRVPNGQAVSLAVTLQSVSTGGGQVGGIVPAGYYRRLRSVNTTGSQTFSYNSGQEVLN